jgi:hypothetical protein
MLQKIPLQHHSVMLKFMHGKDERPRAAQKAQICATYGKKIAEPKGSMRRTFHDCFRKAFNGLKKAKQD